jgi:glucose/arabinose dehydrogenase
MKNAYRTGKSLLPSRRFTAGALAAGLTLLGGCQMPDSLTGDRDKNTLAVGFAVPPPKFADGIFASGFNTPMAMEFSPDGRLFVLEKSGNVKVIPAGGGAASTFLTLSVDQNTERGLLGIAFDPQWSTQKYVYINYSVNGGNHNRVSRFTVSASNPNAADPASEVDLIDISPLTNSAYHNGGALHFGTDGYLYITTGDNRLTTNSQDMTNLLGKILRISKVPSGTAGQATIPAGNPFTNLSGNLRAIWGIGLRNPYTFNVQPGTGRIFINDIGEAGYEEINEATQAGLNFGWPRSEGPTTLGGINAPIGGYVNGYAANGNQYNIADCAIIGSTFYNPGTQMFPSGYVGRYFYGDHCSQYIKYVDPAAPTSPTTFATSLGGNLMDLDVGPDGALYYLTLNGNVGRITYTGVDAPTIARQPASQTVSVGQSATLTVEANGGQLSYQWLRWNGSAFANIAGATGTSYTFTPALSDNGAQFQVKVTNPYGTATSSTATISVISNQPPVPNIANPLHSGAPLWAAGQTISFSGSATDPEDGSLPVANLTWSGVLVHGSHTHPAFGPIAGVASGSFTIPTVNEASDDISYRIYLQATDSKGLTRMDSVTILPQKVTLTLNTVPAGLTVNLDGQPKTTPLSFLAVVGVQRNLEALSQTVNGQAYNFASWSDGQAAKHDISTPNVNTTYTATFSTVGGAIAIPGKIQAEDYKSGGEGVGYHDLSAGNTGGQYRTDKVDIEATTDAGGGYNVGWIDAGEWLDYSINVASAGTYTLTMRMASANAGTKTATVSVDGAVKATFNSTDASGWQSWKDVAVSGVSLAAGAHTLRIAMTTGGFNVNYLNIASAGNVAPIANAGADKSVNTGSLVTLDGRGSSDPDNGPQALSYSWSQIAGTAVTLSGATTSQPSFTPAAAGSYTFRLTVSDGALTSTDDIVVTATTGSNRIALPGRIQAEDYNVGGEGVGYHDLSAGNTGGQYRTDNVDIEATTDAGGGYNVGWIDAAEWLQYDVSVATAGTYNLTARVASASAGTKTLSVSVDGGAAINFSFTDASGWQSWKDVLVSGVSLAAGNHTIRFTMATGGFNLNYVDVTAGGSANLLANGDFANGIVSWNTYFASPATGSITNENGSARITIDNAGVNEWDIQLWQASPLTAGKTYTLDFDVKAEATPKNFKIVVEHNGDPWTKYVELAKTVTTSAGVYQHYTVTWTQGVADAGGRVVFDFAAQNLNDLWVDNVVLK